MDIGDVQPFGQRSSLVLEIGKTKENLVVNGECSEFSSDYRAQLTRTSNQDRNLSHPPLGKGGPFISDYQRPVPHLRRTVISTGTIAIHGPPSSTSRKNNIFVRPAPMAARAISRSQSAVIARANDWSNWVEVAVQFSGFPTNTNTKDIWNVFKNEGDILTIELFDDYNGNPNGRGRIRFRQAYPTFRDYHVS